MDSLHPRASSSMPVRYADESVKLLSQQRVKLHVLKSIQHGLSLARGIGHTFSWPQLLQSSWPQADDVGPGATVETAATVPVGPTTSVSAQPALSSSCSSSSVSSSSSSTSEEDEVDLASFEWVVPQNLAGRIHRAHPTKVSKEGFARPACCAISGVPHSGTGVFEVMAEFPHRKWCERCAADICVRLTSTD